MGWPGPYSHSRLGAETETSLCSLDREKTKRGLEKCAEGPLENINWHSYFQSALGLLEPPSPLHVLSWKPWQLLLPTSAATVPALCFPNSLFRTVVFRCGNQYDGGADGA